jgi:hypothetical protein
VINFSSCGQTRGTENYIKPPQLGPRVHLHAPLNLNAPHIHIAGPCHTAQCDVGRRAAP